MRSNSGSLGLFVSTVLEVSKFKPLSIIAKLLALAPISSSKVISPTVTSTILVLGLAAGLWV